jgi:serpin B
MSKTRLIRLFIFTGNLVSLGIGLAASAQTAQTGSMVADNTAFALDLYSHVSGTPGNLFFSPFSISTCLAMTYAGARGETETQMRKTLHLSEPQEAIPASFAKLFDRLNEAEKQNGIQLETANALWAQKGEPFLPAFLKTAGGDYRADIQQANFTTEADAVTRRINGWVARKTRDKIRDILSPDSLNDLTRLILVNAIYFNGTWDVRFEKDANSVHPFHLSANTQADAICMTQVSNVRYSENQDFQAVELSYRGQELSMVILLPQAVDGIGQLEKQLTPAFLDGLLSRMAVERVAIGLPKFKIESRFTLNDALANMGMPDAFRDKKADFSGMTGNRDLHISSVIHKAWVEVNEEGTEAAAATVVHMAGRGAPLRAVVFRADHPFLFLIRDRPSGSVLFIGRLANPGQQSDL